MPIRQCTATVVTSGAQCTYNTKRDSGLCGIHDRVARRLEEETAQRDAAAAAEEARRHAEEMQRRAEEEALRDQQIAANRRRLDGFAQCCVDDILRYMRLLGDIWIHYSVPDLTLAQAYAALRKTSVLHAGWAELLQATIHIINVAYYDPMNRLWSDLSEQETNEAIARIRTALASVPPVDLARTLKVGDKVYQEYQRRLHAERVAAEARRVAEREAARRAAFDLQLRTAPVVFQRDPEGSINLRAFANDLQSVHRSSVQTASERAVQRLMMRVVLDGQDTLSEIITAFQLPNMVRFVPGAQERAITEVTNDYFTTTAFNTPYSEVLDRIWTYISTHSEKRELIIRLAQEICEGVGQCVNGKMARLINVLQGYDEDIMNVTDPPKEAFQARFAKLRDLPMGERSDAATHVFNEYNISTEERNVWLEPLLSE